MTRAEIIERQQWYGLPDAWVQFAINLPTNVREEHLVEIRAPHFGLTLRGTIDIRLSSTGDFVHINYGEFQDQVVTLMNERMQVEAGVPR